MALLPAVFVSGVYASPLITTACQSTFNQVCVFVVNFPKSQNVTVTNFPGSTTPTQQISGEDIQILKLVPGVTTQTSGVRVVGSPPQYPTNFTASFAFAPVKGFTQINQAFLTVIYTVESGSVASYYASFNGHAANTLQSTQGYAGEAQTVIGSVRPVDLKPGSNTINLAVTPPCCGNVFVVVYEVRLTVEYIYFA